MYLRRAGETDIFVFLRNRLNIHFKAFATFSQSGSISRT